jgi:hypothetical protein
MCAGSGRHDQEHTRHVAGGSRLLAGRFLDRPPSTQQGAYEVSVQLLGRLTDPAQFGDVLLKSGAEGRLVRVRDIGRIELGAVDYSTNAYLDDKRAVAVPVFQRPGSNALQSAQRVQALMASLRSQFPPGLELRRHLQHVKNTRPRPNQLLLDTRAEDSQPNVYAGELEVRPSPAPTARGSETAAFPAGLSRLEQAVNSRRLRL